MNEMSRAVKVKKRFFSFNTINNEIYLYTVRRECNCNENELDSM